MNVPQFISNVLFSYSAVTACNGVVLIVGYQNILQFAVIAATFAKPFLKLFLNMYLTRKALLRLKHHTEMHLYNHKWHSCKAVYTRYQVNGTSNTSWFQNILNLLQPNKSKVRKRSPLPPPWCTCKWLQYNDIIITESNKLQWRDYFTICNTAMILSCHLWGD